MHVKDNEVLLKKVLNEVDKVELGVIHSVCKIADKLGVDRDDVMEVFVDLATDFSEIATIKDFNLNTISNADKIRAMTDEELAEWIHNIQPYSDRETDEPMLSIINLDTNEETDIHDSYGDLLEWLQQTESEG